MGVMDRIGARASWGPAEQAALDRCLSVPGVSERGFDVPGPVRLSRTIETEIIPRLMLAHRDEPEEQPKAPPGFTAAEIGAFTRIVLERTLGAALREIEEARARGHSLEAVFLSLLAPTARLLGDMWRDDLCSFADVTIGLSRLQQVLRELSPQFELQDRPDMRGRILLAAVPGEQHSFGVSMLESFFRRAGWEVRGGAVHARDELLGFVREEYLDAVGLSLSSDVLYEQARSTISALRGASLNPSLYVMVGGRYFTDHPHHATEIGADSAASDASDALRRADTCLSRKLARC